MTDELATLRQFAGALVLVLVVLAPLIRHNRVEPLDQLTDAQRVDLMERECRIGPYADRPAPTTPELAMAEAKALLTIPLDMLTDAHVDRLEQLADVVDRPRPRLPDPGRYPRARGGGLLAP